MITNQAFIEMAAYMLRESFEGSPEGQPSVYLDRGIGLFATLDRVSGEAASKGHGGTTIAAQVEHTKFYLDRICEFLDGRTEAVNWEDSWLIETVSEEEWRALLISVKTTYEQVLRCLAGADLTPERSFGMAFGMVAHTAYHLGAVRQIVKSFAGQSDTSDTDAQIANA